MSDINGDHSHSNDRQCFIYAQTNLPALGLDTVVLLRKKFSPSRLPFQHTHYITYRVCVCVCLCADCFVEDMQNYAIREFIGTALQCEFTAREGDFIYRLIKIGFWKGGPTMMIFCSVLETN